MDWDLTDYFPAFDHPSRIAFEQELASDLQAAYDVVSRLPVLEDDPRSWADFVVVYEELNNRRNHLSSYVHALASADGNNADYRDAEARFSALDAARSRLQAQLIRGLGAASEETFEGWLQDPKLSEAQYTLTRLRARARMSMSSDLEELAADLGTDGIEAWSRLYDGIMAGLEFEFVVPGQASRRLPFSARRSLMEDADRGVRRAAFEAGNAALQPWTPVLARALNHIAGTRLTLARHRNSHVLDASIFDAGITRATLDAMFEGVQRHIELPRQVLALKAQVEGVPQVAWYDVGAQIPVAQAAALTWQDAVANVSRAFERKYPKLGDFFLRAIERRWVDYQGRPGKRAGAFCTTSKHIGQSRVFMTFGGTLGDVSTLAHEIGHAFHSALLLDQRCLASQYPMTLAESASTFAELLLVKGLLDDPSLGSDERLTLLAALVNDAPVFLLDVHARYRFEVAFYEERRTGEVRLERINELMSETQRRVFGDVLDPQATDPYFWASKLHFFLTDVSFYNYPYVFGYLLSRGLYARFEQEGSPFLARYEQFLKHSGRAEPAALAKSVLGCDLEQPEFWEQSILGLQAPLATLRAHLGRGSA